MAQTAEIGAIVAQISPLNRILLSPFWTAKCRLQQFPRGAGCAFQRAALPGSCQRQRGSAPASQSAIAPFDGRRLSKVLLLYS